MKLPAGGAGRPGLPVHVAGRRRSGPGDVALGDQDVDGFELRPAAASLGLGRLLGTAGQQRGNATGGDGDRQHDETRGFHTLTLTDMTAGLAA